MPVRWRIYLIGFGAISLALATIVLVLNQDASTELLGSIGVLGGLAMILVGVVGINGGKN